MAKGRKDRQANPEPKILDLWRENNKLYPPVKYLFEGETPGTKYSERRINW